MSNWLHGWLFALLHWQQRRIDLQILWPICRDKAKSLDHARAAFAVHAFNEIAWMCLGEEEVKRRIGELT